MQWKEAPIDAMLLSMYYLQGFFKFEVLRGKCGLGEFKLKPIHSNCHIDRELIQFPNEIITPNEIIERVKGNMEKTSLNLNEPGKHIQQNIQEHTEVVDSSNAQRSLAISAIRDNKVHLSTAAQSFVVEGTRGDKYAVTLHLKESCQCEALGTCWHIIAANLSIGIDDSSEKRVYNLTQLRRNQRKKPNKKAGKKQPRPCDEETIINAAPPLKAA